MLRKIIHINEDKCTGCGLCVPNCHEGALQIIDGKARLISDLMCDGLGACLGHCPEDAITIEERDAEPYDEKQVMLENIIPAGKNTIMAHLEHLQEHNEHEYLSQALQVLEEKGIANPLAVKKEKAARTEVPSFGGCPGSRAVKLEKSAAPVPASSASAPQQSELQNWPVQLHLAQPGAGYFKGADILLAADCVAFAYPEFHNRLLKERMLVIACPKLDDGQEIYLEKLVAMIERSGINTLTVARMEVPCCGGLVSIASAAAARASRKIPVKEIVIGINGELQSENWI